MRLHGAGVLGVSEAERILEPHGVQTRQLAHRRGGAEDARGGRSEEPQPGFRRHADGRRHIDAERQCEHQCPPRHTACPFRIRQRRGLDCRQRMHHRGLVYAVELLIVGMKGVDHRGGAGGQSVAHPQHRGFIAAAPSAHRGAHLRGVPCRGAGNAHPDRVEAKRFHRRHRRPWKVLKSGGDDVLDETLDGLCHGVLRVGKMQVF